ncbi:hypothetical protein SIO70_01695 [Chitinophaga sancti]|uniref:hypothetical protein n=1 Tax=Chitinophaga sancti TaxID=1004 RepID=UPI002A75DFEC|nr:hypothetical protein [Chitinophaga sancti]WPQ63578.1 hypothetical protein SIO70_01695 [Chitinophaga sancti]
MKGIEVSAQAKDSIVDAVSVTGMKKSYKKGEVIQFCLKNNLTREIFIEAIELYSYFEAKKEWYIQVFDILNPDCKEFAGVTMFKLRGNGTKVITWNPKKMNPHICFDYKVNKGKYLITFLWSDDFEKDINLFKKVEVGEFVIQ